MKLAVSVPFSWRDIGAISEVPASSGRIAALEADIAATRATRVIDARGKLVTPGLIDLHAHVYPHGSKIGLPADDQLESALLMAQGMSEEKLNQNVMFGSAARDAVNFTARLVREAGGGAIDARTLAYGIVQSGELGPMFYSALGTTRAELVAVL